MQFFPLATTFTGSLKRWLANIALGLCAVMSLNIMAIPLTYLDFTLRQDYYANVLCENQDQPIAICGGRCFVDKQIATLQMVTQPVSDPAPVAPTLEIDLSLYVVTDMLHFVPNDHLAMSVGHSDTNPSFPSDYPTSVFHPPQV
ncbi:MAG: hypothetical protein AAF632_25290 [Bacteroidota bacterium]